MLGWEGDKMDKFGTAARWLWLGELAAWGGIAGWAPACAGITPGVW